MIKITITVSGPGGCFNEEIDTICQALIKAGHEVTVNNNHASSEEEKKISASRPKAPSKIHVIANHIPWGG